MEQTAEHVLPANASCHVALPWLAKLRQFFVVNLNNSFKFTYFL